MKQKFRVLSDLHLEFGLWFMPPQEDDHETVLILAGDIHVKGRVVLPTALRHEEKDQTVSSWMEHLQQRYKAVLVILGNHDYWGGCINRIPEKIKEYIQSRGWNNVHLLDDDYIDIDGVRYVGSTFWTDMNHGDAMSRIQDEATSNNYRKIKYNYSRKIKSEHLELKHMRSKRYIEQVVAESKLPVVLAMHQAPAVESWYNAYPNKPVEWGDVSDLAEWINSLIKVVYVVHGHIHETLSYWIGNKNVITNPRGYNPDHLNELFDHTKTWVVDTSEVR